MGVHPFLRLVRWPNLLIVAVTQYSLQYLVLAPALQAAGRSPTLDHFHFFLLVLDTLLVTAAGYIVNDLLDLPSDLVNKPEKVFINRHFSLWQGYVIYSALVLAGLFLAWHLALHVGHPAQVLLYPVAVVLLWLYSLQFKKWPLWGNIVVSLFVSFVAGIVLFAEREAMAGLLASGVAPIQDTAWVFAGYLLFAFFSTLCREIVKDMEDLDGDRLRQAMTLPARYGLGVAKCWALASGVILLALLAVLARHLAGLGLWASFLYLVVALAVPTAAALLLIYRAKGKRAYGKASLLLKYIMLAGLILLFLWKY